MNQRILISIVSLAVVAVLLLWWLWQPAPTSPTSATPQGEDPATPTPVATDSGPDENPASTAKLTPTRAHTVDGRLVDTSGEPIVNGDILYRLIPRSDGEECEALEAVDFALDAQTDLTHSNQRGHFTLLLPPADSGDGRCLLVNAAKPGFFAITWRLDRRELPEPLVLELSGHHTLKGRVETAEGGPAPDAEVRLWTPGLHYRADRDIDPCTRDPADTAAQTPRRVHTDEQGRFSADISAGERYCLQATHPEWARSAPRLLETTGQPAAGPADVVLSLQPARRVRATLLDPQEQPVPNLPLVLTPEDDAASARTGRSDAAGVVRLSGLDATRYQLSTPSPQHHIAKPARIDVSEARSLDRLEILVEPVTQIRGQVLGPDGQPLEGVRVSARSPYLPPERSLSRVTTDSDGRFEIASLHRSDAAGKMFSLLRQAPDRDERAPAEKGAACLDFYHPMYRVETQGVHSTADTLDVGKIYAQSATAPLAGVVKNHQGKATEAELTFQRDPPREPATECRDNQSPISLATDANGRFRFNLPTPGRYQVTVNTHLYQTRQFERTLSGDEEELILQLD